jgi:hypothetical protein
MGRPIRDARQFSIHFIRNRPIFMYVLYGLSESFFSLIRYTWLWYLWLNKPIISPATERPIALMRSVAYGCDATSHFQPLLS